MIVIKNDDKSAYFICAKILNGKVSANMDHFDER